jgi:two-component system chemotaxis response regulator CheB
MTLPTDVRPGRPIRVLVVDDSAIFRLFLTRALAAAEGIEVCGIAADGLEALEAVKRLRPDVVTLDVEMPRLDGLATLDRLLAQRPVRVVMLSMLTGSGASVTMDALRAGALDAIAKPSGAWSGDSGDFVRDLLAKIRAAALVPIRAVIRAAIEPDAPAVPRPYRDVDRSPMAAQRLVIVATSTGGPKALDTFFRSMPGRLDAGVIVIQHMLNGFTTALADRLDRLGPMRVREATDLDRVPEGVALLAPGDRHLLVDAAGAIRLVSLPHVNGVRPAADVTLISAAPAWGDRLLSVVLTGMGRDGTTGSTAVHAHGGQVFAQDEATSVIYGMPRAVAEAGIVDCVLPLADMAAAVAAWAARPSTAGSARQVEAALRKRQETADISAGASRQPASARRGVSRTGRSLES